jgi:hypothetical protein
MRLAAVISLKDNYSAIMKQAAKNTSSFRGDVDKAKKSMDAAFKREQKLRLVTTEAHSKISRFDRAMKSLKDKTVTITARTERFFEQHTKLAAMINRLTRAPAVITFTAKDMITGTLPGILKAGVGAAAVGTAGTVGLGLASLKGASSLERNMISMEHFIGVNNKGMSADMARAEADRYLTNLRKNADLTPFETNDVISTGTRAIGVAAGNTSQAMNLLRLSEDMAALTPGKSLSDAIEALADLKSGETERMKEFGFKINQEQIKASGGDMSKIRNSEGISLTDMFKGGSEKLGQSSEGLWSTITGTMKSGITDMGKASLEILKPQLKSWADYLSGGGAKKMFDAGSRMMAGVMKATVEATQELQGWISRRFLNNIEFQNIPTFRGKFRYVLNELKNEFNGWYEQDGSDMLSDFLKNSAGMLRDTASIFREPAMKIGTTIGQGLIDGLQEMIKDHPMLSGMAAAAASPGPLPVKVIAGAAVAGEGYKEQFRDTGIGQNVVDWNEKYLGGAIQRFVGWGKGKANEMADSIAFLSYVSEENLPNTNGIMDRFFNKESKKKAIGMKRVPYDNYPALLHQDEQVLTAQESRSKDSSRTPVTINLYATKSDSDFGRLMQHLKAAVESAGFNMAPGGEPG